jgi:ATP-dependent exoDNAse (exonuclease V) alpha subunit
VLFVGDTRQHEAVDAGRPYAQLQEAGMQTAQLTEIIRQQDAALKATVEQLSVGDVEGAIRSLAAQGRVHEYTEREERIQAIARAYVEQPENTLVISPDNASRMEIATTIHAEMQKLGKVSQEEQAVTVLVARQNITSEDRLWAQNYEPGDVLRYTRGNQTIGVAAREMAWVSATDDHENLITVERENGELITYDPRKVNGVTVYQEAERSFAEGDRIQFTTAFHPQKIANRELGTIAALDEAGNLKLQMDSGRTVDFNLHQHPHLDYGYAVTSHSSQGETADNVLIQVDAEHAHKGLINSRMAYVAVSRARFDAQIFTNDAESLSRELGKDVSHSTALQPGELNQLTESFNQLSNEHSGPAGVEFDDVSIGQDLAM